MFKVNDVVVYGTQGVCEIIGIEDRKIGGEIKKYFVLKPKNDKGATCYIPTWNEKAWSKMRKVITKKEIDALIDSMPNKEPIWIANENERKETYMQILASGDQAAIIAMVQALFSHKKGTGSRGKTAAYIRREFYERGRADFVQRMAVCAECGQIWLDGIYF